MQFPYALPAPSGAGGAPDAGFSAGEVSAILAPIHARGDRMMWRFVVFHVAVALALAPFFDTWRGSILWAGISAAAFWLCYRFAPGTFLTRAMAGVVLESFCALHIWQMGGQPEQHFWFFVGFTMMIVYQDWLCMWPGALLIILQHIVFAVLHNLGYPVHFFPDAHVDFTKLFFHFGIAIVHVAVCGYWAWILRQQTLSDARQKEELVATQQRTEREAAERIRAETARRQLELKMAESQKLESLGVLAGGVAHDFNNLLVGILGNASLARAGVTDGTPLAATIGQIEDAAGRAAELTRQMLAYSGKGRFVVRPLELSGEVTEICRLIPSMIAKTTELRLVLAQPSPWIPADSSQLAQVVMNLVVNGSEALPEEGGTVTLLTDSRHVDAAWLAQAAFAASMTPGRYAALTVIDNGSGMSPETVERIFDPFFSTRFVGRGLGLAAVLGIVRGHGGAIRVESAPGHGTRFTVLFPETAERPAPPSPPTPATGVPAAGAEGDATVLVVDDEPGVRQLASRMLERAGYRTICAGGGREALSLYAKHREEIGLVLLDLSMPDLHGREVLARIRAEDAQLPVIISSGLDAADAPPMEADGRPVPFLPKPYRVADLLAAIRRARPPAEAAG